MDFIKLTTGFADDMLTLSSWMLKKMEAHGTLHNRDDVRGLQAEVSVGIGPGATGEILVVQAKKLHHYPAQAKEQNAEFPRGSKVKIVDVGPAVVFVAGYEPGEVTSTEAVTIKPEAIKPEAIRPEAIRPEAADTTNGGALAGSENVDAEAVESVESETIDADA